MRLLLAKAYERRAHLGMRPVSVASKTCAPACAERRRLRRAEAAWGVRLKRGEWRRDECGCTAAEAIAKDEGPMTARSRVCSTQCAGQRKARTVASIHADVLRGKLALTADGGFEVK